MQAYVCARAYTRTYARDTRRNEIQNGAIVLSLHVENEIIRFYASITDIKCQYDKTVVQAVYLENLQFKL